MIDKKGGSMDEASLVYQKEKESGKSNHMCLSPDEKNRVRPDQWLNRYRTSHLALTPLVQAIHQHPKRMD
jgi:hypothetical protein